MNAESQPVDGRSAEGAVEIEASPEVVWRALTDARELERWFPLEARVEPGVGGTIRLSWRNEFDGESRILEWDPPWHLRTTWGEWDGAEPGQVTDYRIEARGGRTRVRVVTSGFPADAAWDEWVEGTRLGWRYELESLRLYLERHAGRDREVAYLRRRVALDRDAAWARLFAGQPAETVVGGRPFDVDPPRQVAAVLDDPPGAMIRVSIEPTGPAGTERDVTVFLSSWAGATSTLAPAAAWRRRLEQAFPEGRSP